MRQVIVAPYMGVYIFSLPPIKVVKSNLLFVNRCMHWGQRLEHLSIETDRNVIVAIRGPAFWVHVIHLHRTL